MVGGPWQNTKCGETRWTQKQKTQDSKTNSSSTGDWVASPPQSGGGPWSTHSLCDPDISHFYTPTPPPHVTPPLIFPFPLPFLFLLPSYHLPPSPVQRLNFQRIFNYTPMRIYNFILIFLVFFKNIFSFLNFFYFLFKSNYTNIKNVENKAI